MKNKYNYEDKVSFKLDDKILTGTIYIIDKNGTFEFPNDVCYDIIVSEEKYVTKENPEGLCLYKHIKESEII